MTTHKDYLEHNKQQSSEAVSSCYIDQAKHDEIDLQIYVFLSCGGKIQQVPSYVSQNPKGVSQIAKDARKDSLGRDRGAWHDLSDATMRKAKGEGL